MKKILLMAVSLGALCASAESYLYWMVGDTGSYTYDKTQIRVLNNGKATDTYLSLYYADGTSAGTAISDDYAEAAYAAELGMYAAIGAYSDTVYSFLIELRNDNGAFVAQSGSFTYSTVANQILESGIGAPSDLSGSAWAPPSGGYAIPEPTSGLMLLLGMAALALRRRRV